MPATEQHGIKPQSCSTLYDDVTSVTVMVNGEAVEVEIDPEGGPKILTVSGTPGGPNDFQKFCHCPPGDRARVSPGNDKPWKYFTSTERELAVHIAAKKNKQRKALMDAKAQLLDVSATPS
eukprot:TRINITY_DN36279_c0_g1_i1.p1 TRINITY_DN36279_c0_g1~~TRINITY_DN36279_c0_g1_i1.p1  ORF type:complete len:121 (-),score=21.04 TRINITY_DN36279_c0_g1_i1:44-406(-)